MLVQRTRHRHRVRRLDVPRGGRPLRIGDDDLVSGLEQCLAQDVEGMDAAGRDHHLVGAADRRAVLRSQLVGKQVEQVRQTGGLEVVSLFSSMARCIARFTVSGASKLTSP